MGEVSLIEGNMVLEALISKKYEQIYNQFSPELKGLVTLNDFNSISKEFIADETNFTLVSSSLLNGYNSYIWHNEARSKGIIASIDEHLIIQGFQIVYLQSNSETDKLFSQVSYQLPFNEQWYVFWGGHDVLNNYHYEYEDMRYAYDFVITVDGYSYNGDPLKNESYYAFNKDIVAPADGIVRKVVNDIEDNIPGQFNELQPEGNMVVIEHEAGEYSIIAHFKHQSIVVKEGDKVVAGQLLGQTGNSGNSSEPHIHFQVNKVNDSDSNLSIPITFTNGKQWVRGDQASN